MGSGAAERLCGDADEPSSAGLCLRAGCTGTNCVATEPQTSGGGSAGDGGSGGTGGMSDPNAGDMGGSGGGTGPGGAFSGSDAGGVAGMGGTDGTGGTGEGLQGTVDPSEAITDPETTGTTGACAGHSVADVLAAIHEKEPSLSDIDQLSSTEFLDETNAVYAFTYEDRFRFVLKRGSGDCVAECIDGEYWYFHTDANCKPIEIHEYSRIFGETGTCYTVIGQPLWDFPEPVSADDICTTRQCMVDNCRPEVCDAVGEGCCDPFPRDGPNSTARE